MLLLYLIMRLMSVVIYDSTPLFCKFRNFVENDIFIEILIEDRNFLRVFQEFCTDFTMFYREYRRVSYLKSSILISLRIEN